MHVHIYNYLTHKQLTHVVAKKINHYYAHKMEC